MKGTHVALTVIAGAALTAAVATIRLMPLADSLLLSGIAGATATTAGLIGAVVVNALRRRSLGIQATAASLTSVAAVALGAAAAARTMFISSHDLDAVLVVLTAAVAVGVVVSMVLGDRLSMAAMYLGAAAHRIGSGETVELDRPLPAELSDVARQIQESSARLMSSRKRERMLEESRRELIAWVSHDLRTPLAGIKAMAEALEDGIVEDDHTVEQYHHAMGVEAGRLADLVESLFELSQLQAGTLALQREIAMLGDIVSDALSATAGSARAKGVEVKGHMKGELPPMRLATPEVARALHNLLNNAIRHTPKGGRVTVETWAGAENAYVSVEDQCGGIPEADVERVFEIAFRGQAARTPSQDGGAGLGLAIAKGIVEAHDGRLTVENVGEGGCRFSMFLPLRAQRD